MALQYYGSTGRKYKPDYVGVINANRALLPTIKSLKDEENYRNRLYSLETNRLSQNEQLAKDQLKSSEKASDTSALIGLGQLGYNARAGRLREEGLKQTLSGGETAGKAPGTVQPTVTPEAGGSPLTFDEPYKGGGGAAAVADAGKSTDFLSGLKTGASNWGDIAMGAAVGGTVGAGLGEKYVPIGGTREKRIIGGAATSGLLSYLSSGDPYTAGISALFGGSIGGFL